MFSQGKASFDGRSILSFQFSLRMALYYAISNLADNSTASFFTMAVIQFLGESTPWQHLQP